MTDEPTEPTDLEKIERIERQFHVEANIFRTANNPFDREESRVRCDVLLDGFLEIAKDLGSTAIEVQDFGT